MKVHITGRGAIPGLRAIAPIYNQDLSEKDIRRLLNVPTLRVIDANTNLVINKKNVNNVFQKYNAPKPSIVVQVQNLVVDSKENVAEAVEKALPDLVAGDVTVEVRESDTKEETVSEDTPSPGIRYYDGPLSEHAASLDGAENSEETTETNEVAAEDSNEEIVEEETDDVSDSETDSEPESGNPNQQYHSKKKKNRHH